MDGNPAQHSSALQVYDTHMKAGSSFQSCCKAPAQDPVLQDVLTDKMPRHVSCIYGRQAVPSGSHAYLPHLVRVTSRQVEGMLFASVPDLRWMDLA